MLEKTLAVSSGKGGVGKTFFSVNFALELSYRGYKVLIFDLDFNFSNVFLLLDVKPENRFQNYFEGSIPLAQAVIPTKYKNLDIISAGVDINSFFRNSGNSERAGRLGSDFSALKPGYDFIIIDCGAGVNGIMLEFFRLSDEIILVCNHEITSLTDLYRIIKLLSSALGRTRINLLINKVRNIDFAVNLFREIQKVVERFRLGTELFLLGPVVACEDEVSLSVQKRVPHIELFPHSPIKGGIALAVQRYLFSCGLQNTPAAGNQSMIGLF